MSFSYSNGVITQSNEASKNITAFSNGGTNILTISVSAHGYSVGNLVEIKNTSNYNGVYLITSKTTNTFNVSTFTVDDIENSFVATDTGTVQRGDADNSGLFGLTDVDRDDSGTKYTISNSVIEIEGAWLLDPEINELVFSDTYTSPFCLITRKAGCFFQIGTKKKDNNNVSYSKGSAITTTSVFAIAAATFSLTSYGLMQSESSLTSRFRAFGGVINTTLNVAIAGSNSNFNSLADVNIESLTINNIITSGGNFRWRLVALYFNDSTSNISNLNVVVSGIKHYFDIRNDRGLSNASFTLERANINTDFQSAAPKTFVNCVFGKNLNAFGTRLRVSSSGADFYDIYTNNDIGSAVVTDQVGGNRKGQYITRQILNITSKDVNQNNINAKFYLSDNVGSNPSSTLGNPATINFNNQFSYSTTASNGSASINIITSYVKKISNSSPVTHYRSKSDSDSDDYTLHAYKYGNLPLSLPLVAKGTNGTDISAIFSQDQAISQPSKTIVDGYPISILIVSNTITVTGDNTTIQNLTSTQLYDVLASYLEDNHGTYTQFLVTRSGNEINANGYNVDLSYINYTGDMVTDQVITLSNGSIFNGTRTDQNGTVYPPIDVTFTNLQVGSQLVVYLTGTTTEKFRTNNSGTSEQWTEVYTTDINYDVTIQKTGFFPIRLTNLTASTIPITTSINQLIDRAYQTSSGLTYSMNANLNTSTKEFSVSVDTTVQNYYSFWIEQWISNSVLRNIKFPISTFGGNSFSFDDGYEFTNLSLQYLSRDGFRYFDNGTVTARYAAILSQGVSTGLQAEYQQAQGGSISDAQNTGNVDQVIQIYGDSTHGNFDYTDYLVFKVQGNGFRQDGNHASQEARDSKGVKEAEGEKTTKTGETKTAWIYRANK